MKQLLKRYRGRLQIIDGRCEVWALRDDGPDNDWLYVSCKLEYLDITVYDHLHRLLTIPRKQFDDS